MQISHERATPFLSEMVRAPLRVFISDDQFLTIEEWSLTSIRLPHKLDIIPKNAVICVPFQGVWVNFRVEFEAGLTDDELVFKNLNGREKETLAVFYRSILSGKMAVTKDVITSLDTPVDLVPMDETKHEAAANAQSGVSRAFRMFFGLVTYSILAVILVGLIGGQILSRLLNVELLNARIVAPGVALQSPDAAILQDLLVENGDRVVQGQILARLIILSQEETALSDAPRSVNIIAPFDGTVSKLNALPTQALALGQTILDIEEDAPRAVQAWIADARASSIYPGMPVTIDYRLGPDAGSTTGVIASIRAIEDPQPTDEQEVVVTIAFDALEPSALDQTFPPEMPVQVRAQKDWGFALPWMP